MSEQGHAKNLANFAQYIAIVTALGAAYKPGNPKIEITNLQDKLTEAQTAFNAVVPKATIETNKVSERHARLTR